MSMMLRLSGMGHRRQWEQTQVSEIRRSLAQWNHINQKSLQQACSTSLKNNQGTQRGCWQIMIWYPETKGISDFRQGWIHYVGNNIRNLFIVVLMQVSICTMYLISGEGKESRSEREDHPWSGHVLKLDSCRRSIFRIADDCPDGLSHCAWVVEVVIKLWL
jgi:hypothetical protein